ncbi:MAG: hypothetical protein HDR88_00120 [Bacteroides sp.]|nr:hypothetical protein [Bacteroides sp.]
MKDNDNNILTLQETEELCRLYMECSLSVHEETELQYVLGKLTYSSPLIDEVRTLMGVQSSVAKINQHKHKTISLPFWKRPLFISVAASVALLVGIGIPVYKNSIESSGSDKTVYIAYANGVKMNKEQSIAQVEADMKRAEAFMNHIAKLEEEEEKKIENFMNHISL